MHHFTKNTYIGAILAIILVVVAAVLLYQIRPLDDILTPAGIAASVQTSRDTQLLTLDIHSEEQQTNADIPALLDTGSWSQTEKFDTVDPALHIHLGDMHELYLFDGGKAYVFYGYPQLFHKCEAFYSIPAEVLPQLLGTLRAAA